MVKKILIAFLALVVVGHLVAALVIHLRKPPPFENLVAAVQKGDTAAIGKWVKAGRRIDSATGELSPIHLAAANGNVEIVKLLAGARAKVNAPDANGDTPMHLAAANGNVDVMETLLSCGADVESKNKEGGTPLASAIGAARGPTAEFLLSRGARLSSLESGAFQRLGFYGPDSMIAFLVEKGIDINAPGENGQTILDLAVEADKTEVVRYLLDHGAAPNTPGFQEQTAIFSIKSPEVGRLLVERGADPGYRTRAGVAALMSASEQGRIAAMEYLLSVGANPDEVDSGGRSALHYAATNPEDKAARLLIARGASLDIRDKRGWTPLMASLERMSAATGALIEAGADVQAADGNKTTALHIASQYGLYPSALQLIAAGADVNARDSNGATPLHWAALSGQSQTVKILLEAGADPEIRDNAGLTPLDLAREIKVDASVKLLTPAGTK